MSSRSSRTTEAPAASEDSHRDDLPDRVAVGRVLRPHGLRGDVVVEVLSDVPGRFDPGSRLLAVRGERPERTLTVVESLPHKSGARIRFEGIADHDGAEALRGLTLEVERAEVPAAEPGTYYYYELLGCRCRDGERELGTVVDVVEDGGGLLLIVADGERRVPVPFVARFLQEVDVARGRIVVDLPPGLLAACASKS